MLRFVRIVYVALILAAFIGGPWGYWTYRERTARNFHVVEDKVLYRSGQVPVEAFERLVHDYGIRTVICLREGDESMDIEEEEYCRRWGIHHVRIPPLAWWASKGPVPAEKGLAVFRRVMDDPAKHPVLIHCFAGSHRTGAYCAVYRMDYQGWSNEQALAEMKHIGYRTIESDWDLLTYLENYRPGTASVPAQPVSRPKNP